MGCGGKRSVGIGRWSFDFHRRKEGLRWKWVKVLVVLSGEKETEMGFAGARGEAKMGVRRRGRWVSRRWGSSRGVGWGAIWDWGADRGKVGATSI